MLGREIEKVRIFYRKSDGKVVWTHSLVGLGNFPTTMEQDLKEIPDKIPDGLTGLKLGGNISDYDSIEETDKETIASLMDSDENEVKDGQLIVGQPRIKISPEPKRDALAEIDELKAEIEKLKVKE